MAYIEPGHVGTLVSLAGIVGRPGAGRKTEYNGGVVPFAAAQQCLPANMRRISALIQMIESTTYTSAYINVFFGSEAVARLYPRGSLLIDSNFPWCGEISLQAVTTAGYVFVNEVSVSEQ